MTTPAERIASLPARGMVYAHRATGVSARVVGVYMTHTGCQMVVLSVRGEHGGTQEQEVGLGVLMSDFRVLEARA